MSAPGKTGVTTAKEFRGYQTREVRKVGYLITSIGMVSQRWYDGLPSDIQQAVVEEARAVHPELLEWTRNFYSEAARVWKEQSKDGWIDLMGEQRAAFRRRMEGVDEKVAQQGSAVREWLALLRAKSKQHAK